MILLKGRFWAITSGKPRASGDDPRAAAVFADWQL